MRPVQFWIFFSSILIFSPAKAASVHFEVGPVVGAIQSIGELELQDAIPYLRCKFEDGSGGISDTPESILESTFWRDDSPESELSYISIEGGSLHASKWFADVKSCGYFLHLTGTHPQWEDQTISTTVTLAGSVWNMTDEELDDLLNDDELHVRIEEKLSPLVVELHPSAPTIRVVTEDE